MQLRYTVSIKRVCAVAVALLSVVWLSGCDTLPKSLTSSSDSSSSAGEPGAAVKEAKNTAFTLNYSSGDSLNPYTAKTRKNLELCSLLYNGLTKIDNTMTPQMDLASTVNAGSQTLTAVIRSDARFSDGSAVTAADVAASFNLAKSSKNYKVLLNDVSSASASGGNTVVFQLNTLNPNALACLSFPVIKNGSGDKPIGSGRYMYVSGDSPTMKANTYSSSKPSIDVIHLLDSSDGDAALLESGSVSYFFNDLSGGEIPRTTSASINVPLNYLVFLGVNEGRITSTLVRQALSTAIDRAEICATAFAGRAQASVSAFNPSWAAASDLKGLSENENVAVAVAQLEQAGYNGSSGNMSTLELLVNKDNNFHTTAADLLKQQLEKTGVKITVTQVSYDDYCDRLKKGSFDLYLGEVRLSADMSLRSLLTSGGAAAYGLNGSSSSVQSYSQYLSGSISLQQFTDAFVNDLPFIPICWQDGVAAYNRALSNVTPTAFDPYYGIDSWVFSNS